jgi:hypothetical protein
MVDIIVADEVSPPEASTPEVSTVALMMAL